MMDDTKEHQREQEILEHAKFLLDTIRPESKIKELEEMLLLMINSLLTKDSSLKTLEKLDHHQIFAIIDKISKKALTNCQALLNKEVEIINELRACEKTYAMKIFNSNLHKKRTRDSYERKKEDQEEENINVISKEEDIHDIEDIEKIENDPQSDDDQKKIPKKQKDLFFSMRDLNQFAREGEEEMNIDKPQDKGEDSENEEAENEEGGDENQEVLYQDFFDAPQNGDKQEKQDMEGEEINEEDDAEDNIFNMENEIITQAGRPQLANDPANLEQIQEIESKMMKKKDWQLKGEISAQNRPKDSLLENPLDFEVSIKPPPIPDKHYTEAIEELIKLRIKDDLFDDPIRKSRVNLNKKPKEEYELKFSKDKKGLSEIYEEEHMNETNPVLGDAESEGVKAEIDTLCGELYSIFDQLTNGSFIGNGSFTNKPKEVKISNVPAIQIEEISNYVSNNNSSTKTAKEMLIKEIEVKTKEEMTQEEKQKEHNRKKRNMRNKLREKERNKKLSALVSATGSKFEARMQMKAEKDKQIKKNLKKSELKSSKFFSNLQNLKAGEDQKKSEKKGRYESDTLSTSKTTVKAYKL